MEATSVDTPSKKGGQPVILVVEIEDYEELKSATVVTMTNCVSENTVSEVIRKIAKKGNVYIIATNYAYGDAFFDLVKKDQGGNEIVLDKNKKLSELDFQEREHVILRKKKQKKLHIRVEIEDYEKLSCARQVGLFVLEEQSVKEVLHIVCRKESVNIPQEEEGNYGLYHNGKFMDYDQTLAFFKIGEKSTMTLKRETDECDLTILIEEYQQLQCVRSTTSLFSKKITVAEVLSKVARKGAVNIPEENLSMFELILERSGERMDKGETLASYQVRSGDVLKLVRGVTSSRIVGTIKSSQIEFTGKIGGGTYGKVYKGLYRNQEVAVKVLKNIPDREVLQEFNHEANMLRQAKCKQIVKLFGTVEESQLDGTHKLMIVMELCKFGSLYHVMHSPIHEIDWDRVFGFGIDMVKGLLYLHTHSPPIVHRDLKSLNLLVTENWRLKLCDFGTSRLTTASLNLDTLKRLRSTPAWSAPELMDENPFTVKSDVYAVGIILWEIVNRCVTRKYKRPFSEFKQIQFDFQIIMQAARGLRPSIPPIPGDFESLIKSCHDSDPSNRPDCQTILQELQRLKQNYFDNINTWNSYIQKNNHI